MLPRPRIILPLLLVVAATGGFALLRLKTPPPAAAQPPGPASRSRDASASTAPDGPQAGSPSKSMDPSRWDALMKINDPAARRRALMDLLAGLRPEDFARAAEKLSALGFAGNSEEMQLLVSAWCAADIHAAAAYALRREVPELISVVAEDWSGRDYDGAVAWALELRMGQGSTVRDYALARIILPTVQQNPRRALETLLRARGYGELAEQVMAAIMSRCPGVVDELVKNMPDGPAKERAAVLVMNQVIFGEEGAVFWTVSMSGGSVDDRIEPVPVFTASELAAAAAWIASHPPTGSETGTRPRLFLEYALVDRPTAVSLAESMPAGATRENALAGVAAAIASSEGLKAGLACLKDSPVETQGLLLDVWSTHLAPKDPGRVLADAGLIADLPFGRRPIIMAFSYLRRSDPSAADRWLEANPRLAPLVEGLH